MIIIAGQDPMQRALLKDIVSNRLGKDCDDLTLMNLAKKVQQKSWLRSSSPNVLLLDLSACDDDNLLVSLIRHLRKSSPHIAIIVLFQDGDNDRAAKAIKAGAVNFLRKPFDYKDIEEVIYRNYSLGYEQFLDDEAAATAGIVSADVVSSQSLLSSKQRVMICENGTKLSLVGCSGAHFEQFDFIERAKFCNKNRPIHIKGETGVGKMLTARIIASSASDKNNNSPRDYTDVQFYPKEDADRDTIIVDSNILPSTFQNLMKDKRLRNVIIRHRCFTSELSRDYWQAEFENLLRNNNIRVIVCETIDEAVRDSNGYMMSAGQQRETLKAASETVFTRLMRAYNAMDVTLEPLRNRKEDIPLLVQFYFNHYTRLLHSQSCQLSYRALQKLQSGMWFGNIRELQNVLFFSISRARNTILTDRDIIDCGLQYPYMSEFAEHGGGDNRLSSNGRGTVATGAACTAFVDDRGRSRFASSVPPIMPVDEDGELRSLRDIEEEILRFALKYSGRSRSYIARRLGIGRTTLYRKAQQMEKAE